MGKRSKGYRSKSKKVFTKKIGKSGRIGLNRILRDYTLNEQVTVIVDPSFHKGMPHRRFHGKVGRILEKRGRSYMIKVPVLKSIKNIIVRPEHLKPLEET